MAWRKISSKFGISCESPILLVSRHRRFTVPHYLGTACAEARVAGRIPQVQPEARLSIQSKADLKETRSELARSVERQRPVFEVVVGDFERRLLKEAVPDILGERPASKLDRESATSRDSETDLKLVDTSSYGRLGSYNEAAVEQAYQAHTASHVRWGFP